MKFKSPSIIMPRLELLGNQVEVLQQKNYRLAAVVKMLKEDTVEASNIDAEVLFDPEDLKRYYEDLLRNDEVGEKEIMGYLFRECIEVGKRIKLQGTARGHRCSGLLIQFACMFRARCSADMYDFFRKVFNLPTNATLCQYSSSDSTSPDGLMMQTIIHIADIYIPIQLSMTKLYPQRPTCHMPSRSRSTQLN